MTNLDQTLLIGTRNSGKLGEIREALSELKLTIVTLDEIAVTGEPEENGVTYEENAAIKAEFYVSATGWPVLADDSGLEVVALDHGPGLYTARYGGTRLSDQERCDLLLRAMEGVNDRRASFYCCFALSHDGITRTISAACSGRISLQPAGKRGFGFDPIFIPDGYEQTFAQLPRELKAKISHRGRALASVRKILGDVFVGAAVSAKSRYPNGRPS